MAAAKDRQAPYELVRYVHENGRLPVVNFCAGGVATPADASLMMQLGADGVFVGSGIFKSGDPARRARAIVEAHGHVLHDAADVTAGDALHVLLHRGELTSTVSAIESDI